MADPIIPGDPRFGWLRSRLAQIDRRLQKLEMPSGTQIAQIASTVSGESSSVALGRLAQSGALVGQMLGWAATGWAPQSLPQSVPLSVPPVGAYAASPLLLTSSVSSAGSGALLPVWIPGWAGIKVDTVSVYVATAGAAGETCTLTLDTANLDGSDSGTVLASVTVPLSTAGVSTVAVASPVTLPSTGVVCSVSTWGGTAKLRAATQQLVNSSWSTTAANAAALYPANSSSADLSVLVLVHRSA